MRLARDIPVPGKPGPWKMPFQRRDAENAERSAEKTKTKSRANQERFKRKQCSAPNGSFSSGAFLCSLRFSLRSLRLCVEIASLVILLTTGCGYHVSGHGDMLPKTVKTIAIPAFGNLTSRYKLARSLPTDIGRELLSRTRYNLSLIHISEPTRLGMI